ncbi:Coq4 family protein [Leptolyngbya sp. AN02str]|uniref:Coq4 family protein n=1 Tax=Leptolyngbya sp. AN02str TaxID=3423363 RepID=UPI003D31C526
MQRLNHVVNHGAIPQKKTDSTPQQPAETQAEEIFQAFEAMLMADLDDSQPVANLSHVLMHSPASQVAIDQLRQDPAIVALLQERYCPPPHSLESLLDLPKTSLGFVYAAYLRQLGYEPGFYAEDVAVNDDASYVEFRWRQTHDIWHLITGFDTSFLGEIGLQAVYLAQCQLPFSSLIVASGLIQATVEAPYQLFPVLRHLEQGWKMGLAAKPLLAQKWEDHWEKPVEVWRSELNIQSVTYPERHVL